MAIWKLAIIYEDHTEYINYKFRSKKKAEDHAKNIMTYTPILFPSLSRPVDYTITRQS